MRVRAKFTCNSITRTKRWNGPGEVQTIKLSPVTSGSDENKEFFDATPTGSIELGTVNEAAAKQFELGKSYYIDFTLAD
jgi:hypothetical protein